MLTLTLSQFSQRDHQMLHTLVRFAIVVSKTKIGQLNERWRHDIAHTRDSHHVLIHVLKHTHTHEHWHVLPII